MEDNDINQLLKDLGTTPHWIQIEEPPKTGWDRLRDLSPLQRRPKYEMYFTAQLRSRYMDIETNFRTTLDLISRGADQKNYILKAKIVGELLANARKILEKPKLEKSDLINASTLLDGAEKDIVWLTPLSIITAKFFNFRQELDTSLKSLLDQCEKKISEIKPEDDVSSDQKDYLHACIEQCVNFKNKKDITKMIDIGLQIERLRALRFWGMILLFLFVFLFPVMAIFSGWPPYNTIIGSSINYNSTTMNSSIISTSALDILKNISMRGFYVRDPHTTSSPFLLHVVVAWIASLSILLIGGIGGFLSGLLQIRSSHTNLALYEESLLLFQLRPLFGGFAALVSFMLLSWGVLSDVSTGSPGSYALIAFLSGFSERYFLSIFKKGPSEKGPSEKEPSEKSPAKIR